MRRSISGVVPCASVARKATAPCVTLVAFLGNETAQVSMDIAFLGTGLMGHPMAQRLLEHGHRVTVYNRTAAKAADLVERRLHGADLGQDVDAVAIVVDHALDAADLALDAAQPLDVAIDSLRRAKGKDDVGMLRRGIDEP